MGTETAEVQVPSDGQPAAPEFVEDVGAMEWHPLRAYAKSIGVSLTADSRIRSKAKLVVAVRERQAEMWHYRRQR